MIKRVLNSKLPLMVYNPVGCFSSKYFIKIHEGGGLPVFDTEFMEYKGIIEIINVLEQLQISFGIRIYNTNDSIYQYIKKHQFNYLTLIILAYYKPNDININTLNTGSPSIFLEIKDIELDDIIQKEQPDGLILRGNEAPGMVSRHTSFTLMQWYLENTDKPIFIHGGVGLHSAAGMFAAGISGVVLDDQLYLSDEAPVSGAYKQIIKDMDAKDTVLINDNHDYPIRLFSKPGNLSIKSLINFESPQKNEGDFHTIYKKIGEQYTSINEDANTASQGVFYLGQDALFANSFYSNHKSVSDIIHYFFSNIGIQLERADFDDPLAVNTPFAKDHKTKYPIIQGPMANVSDNPEFATAISKAGSMPFLALGSTAQKTAENQLKAIKQSINNFGVGIIGMETYQDTFNIHLNLLKSHDVKTAILSGGSPEQANSLTKAGIKTYIHIPSKKMFDYAIESGARRFIFEGSEAGGHVGHLSSFVLWELAILKIIGCSDAIKKDLSIILAGGIANRYGSYFITGCFSMLSQENIKIGICLGTSYLLTEEAVNATAINKNYQNLLLKHNKTLKIGNSVGLPSRTLPTIYAKKIIDNEYKRINEKMPLKARKKAFEKDSYGAHTMAAKMVNTKGQSVNESIHLQNGNFYSGDAIALYKSPLKINELHNRLINNKGEFYSNLNQLELLFGENNQINDEIAIIGMGCIYPDADNPNQFWNNIISKKYSIKEMPKTLYDWELYYDKDRNAEDKSYSKIAGYIKDYKFDHKKFGFSKKESDSFSRSHKLLLDATYSALEDAGYLEKKLPDDKTTVIVGDCMTDEYNDRHFFYFIPQLYSYLEKTEAFRRLNEDEQSLIKRNIKKTLKGNKNIHKLKNLIPSTEASLIAHYLGLSSKSYSVDAACATSLIAIDCAINELSTGSVDFAIVGGTNTALNPETFCGFSKVNGLSDDGSYPFDQRSNGFVLGEGAGVILLKRAKDALNDQDKILGIIKGLGTSSDGKGKAIAAPSTEGQQLALKRCFESIKSNLLPGDIDYIEAHGTSTLAGDAAEINTIKTFYNTGTSIGISSVKSQIGHLMGGAGMASLIKVLLALKHKILPPNGLFEKLSERFNLPDPLFIIKEPEKWGKNYGESRKASISSFGFGGINSHLVVEEYTDSYTALPRNIFKHPDYDHYEDRIVIIGAGCILPEASDIQEYKKILNNTKPSHKHIPKHIYDAKKYENEEDPELQIKPIEPNLVENFEINNTKYILPPKSLKIIDKYQLFALEAAAQALKQANLTRLPDNNRSAVIMGSSLCCDNLYEHIIRARLPLIIKALKTTSISNDAINELTKELTIIVKNRFPASSEDTLPGYLSNIVSGRIANHFNCMGINYVTDCTQASSAIAISNAITGLRTNKIEYAITGGADNNLTPSIFKEYESWQEKTIFTNNNRLGQGAVSLVLTTYKTARKKQHKILAELSDFRFMNIPKENNNANYSAQRLDNIQAFLQQNQTNPDKHSFPVKKNTALPGDKMQSNDWRNEIISNNYGILTASNTAEQILRSIVHNEQKTTRDRQHIIECFNIAGIHGITSLKHFSASISEVKSAPQEYETKAIFNLAAVFPGQGSQYQGMMKGLYNEIDSVKQMMAKADIIFKEQKAESIIDIMFNDPAKLNQTLYTQPAIFTASAAIYKYLENQGIVPSIFIGHSLGELSALYCAGVLDFNEMLSIVIKRAEIMEEASEKFPGTMIAIFDSMENIKILVENSGVENVYVANSNSNNQTIISGKTDDLNSFTRTLKDVAYKKINVQTPFHTPYFKNSAKTFRAYLNRYSFNLQNINRVYSNVTALPYPANEEKAKDILASQLYSPVLFKDCITNASKQNITHFVEIGASHTLSRLIKNISIESNETITLINQKENEFHSFQKGMEKIESIINLNNNQIDMEKNIEQTGEGSHKDVSLEKIFEKSESHFKSLVKNERPYNTHLQQSDFYYDNIVITGVSIGLPGTNKAMFDQSAFDQLLDGINFIDKLSDEKKQSILDKNITRIVKSNNGSAKFKDISKLEDVIKLAGQPGSFNAKDYGLDKFKKADSIPIAAGLEALKDANIPLVKSKNAINDFDYELPEQLQNGTGIIYSSAFPDLEYIINEVTKFTKHNENKNIHKYIEDIYFYLLKVIDKREIKEEITDWYYKLRKTGEDAHNYQFPRDLLLNISAMTGTLLAKHIKAKGPNMCLQATSASSTHAIGIAEDWIRTNRCDRVIVISSEYCTSNTLLDWIGSGMLALGVATTNNEYSDAALPFNTNRNGTILGSGALGIVIEKQTETVKRGLSGQAQLLGTCISNSAFHETNIDNGDIAIKMENFISKIEKKYNLNKDQYAKQLLYFSHESYTPANGGSSEPEVRALKQAFPDHYNNLTITNTKGYTGHLLGTALEDVAMVKALQKGIAPPIPNHNNIPDEFKDLTFSNGQQGNYEYGLHFAAGFGSNFSMLFLKRIQEMPIDNNIEYKNWLNKISGINNAELTIINKALCVTKNTNTKLINKPEEVKTNYEGKSNHANQTEHVDHINNSDTINSHKNIIYKIISELTGYDETLLEDDLDLEADLGIDTVKQVEIFGKISKQFDLPVDDDFQINQLNNIKKINEFINNQINFSNETNQARDHKPQDKIPDIKTEIKEMIATLTGYNTDLLEENLDLEADLGIDTVKQVEIFGKIREKFNIPEDVDLKLNELNTINRLTNYIADFDSLKKKTDYKNIDNNEDTEKKENSKIASFNRLVPSAKEIRVGTAKKEGHLNMNFLITIDNHGFSNSIINTIISKGGSAITIGKGHKCDINIDLSKPDKLKDELIKYNHVLKEVDALIHLCAVDSLFSKNISLETAVNVGIKSFFVLIRFLLDQLKMVAALSINSIVFPYSDFSLPFNPVFGGQSAMLKALKKERKDVFAKIIDFHTDNSLKHLPQITHTFINELNLYDDIIEVGYKKGKRYCLDYVQHEIDKYSSTPPFIKSKATILVTGGARGITFEIIRYLADKYSANFIILGNTDYISILKEHKEFENNAFDYNHIFKTLQHKEKNLKPVDIKTKAIKIQKARIIKQNIMKLQNSGAQVNYYPVDIRSKKDITNLLNTLNYDGIIHGAGIDESKYIQDKSLISFNKVLDTKVKGLMHLLEAEKSKNVGFIIAFSSIVSKIGNRGQTDYAAANEIMNKILLREKVTKPQLFIKAINWPAWDGTGMASEESIRKKLIENEIQFISIHEGIQLFNNELINKEECDILFNTSSITTEPAKSFSFQDIIIKKDAHRIQSQYSFTFDKDNYLKDHYLRGYPVVPGSFVPEIMIQNAFEITSKKTQIIIEDLNLKYFIKLIHDNEKTIRTTIHKASDNKDNTELLCEINSDIINYKGEVFEKDKSHCEATIKLENAEAFNKNSFDSINNLNLKTMKNIDFDNLSAFYNQDILFMGPSMQTIDSLVYLDESYALSVIKYSENAYVPGAHNRDFVLDPILLDGAFQVAGLQAAYTNKRIGPPLKIKKITILKQLDKKAKYYCFCKLKTIENNETHTSDIYIFNLKWELCVYISKYKGIFLNEISDNLFANSFGSIVYS